MSIIIVGGGGLRITRQLKYYPRTEVRGCGIFTTPCGESSATSEPCSVIIEKDALIQAGTARNWGLARMQIAPWKRLSDLLVKRIMRDGKRVQAARMGVY